MVDPVAIDLIIIKMVVLSILFGSVHGKNVMVILTQSSVACVVTHSCN